MATMLKISANRLNMIHALPRTPPMIKGKVWHFQAAPGTVRLAGMPWNGITGRPAARNDTACKAN
jgi:hypothetical protein